MGVQKTPDGLTNEEKDFWKFALVMEQSESENPSAAAMAATLKALLMSVSDERKKSEDMRQTLRECLVQLDVAWPASLHGKVTTLVGKDD